LLECRNAKSDVLLPLLQLLRVIRSETRHLHRLRGEWDKPSTHRSWNDPKAAVPQQAPLAIEDFRSSSLMAGFLLTENECLTDWLALHQEVQGAPGAGAAA
jgi:hypothetical protein